MAKFFLVLTLLAAGAAAGLGWVTYQKIGEVHTTLKKTTEERDGAKRELSAAKITLKDAQDQLSTTKGQLDTANEAVKTKEAQIETLSTEKTTLQGQVDTANATITKMQKDIDDLRVASGGTKNPTEGGGLQGIIADLKKQIEEQKQLNTTLTSQVATATKRATDLQAQIDKHKSELMKPGIEGIVMAVNPGYGFVVISLGDKQGSVPNAEIVVARDGRQIAKLKVTTVEPALSVADIIPDSVAKGQRVLPGDKVIFSGSLAQ